MGGEFCSQETLASIRVSRRLWLLLCGWSGKLPVVGVAVEELGDALRLLRSDCGTGQDNQSGPQHPGPLPPLPTQCGRPRKLAGAVFSLAHGAFWGLLTFEPIEFGNV